MTDAIRLRPITEADVTVLSPLHSNPETASFNWFAWLPLPGGLAESVAKRETLSPEGGMLTVARGDDVVGSVSFHQHLYGPIGPAWDIGVTVVPEARGRGVGAKAQRLLVEYLFATTLANRVEAQTDVENVGEQRALEKAGFVREGVARGAQWRNGAWHDMVVYSVIRSDLAQDRAL